MTLPVILWVFLYFCFVFLIIIAKVITKKISKKSLVLTKTGHGCSNFQKSGIFGNLKVLSVQNCHRFLYPVIFEDFMAILTIKMRFSECMLLPNIWRSWGLKEAENFIKLLKPVNLDLLTSYETLQSNFYYK